MPIQTHTRFSVRLHDASSPKQAEEGDNCIRAARHDILNWHALQRAKASLFTRALNGFDSAANDTFGSVGANSAVTATANAGSSLDAEDNLVVDTARALADCSRDSRLLFAFCAARKTK